jgi:seryl-tRNA synthetase
VIDPRTLRDDPDRVRAAQVRRGLSADVVDEAVRADERRRATIVEFERLRSEQKTLGKQVPRAQGEEKQALLERTKALSAEVRAAEAAQVEAEETARALLASIPNLAAEEAPAGGEDDYVVLEHVGEPRDFAAEGFTPRDHVDLGRTLGAIDIERGVKVSGARFYYLTGAGADLELALVAMAMDQARRAGFVPVVPPALVRPRAMEGTGFLGQAAKDVYHLDDDDLYLVGTSEVPLASMHEGEILPADALPLRYAGFSPCFRREAGAAGKDTRGIFRVHQFDKVEMFCFVEPDAAAQEHERLLAIEESILSDLEIPYRVVNIAVSDLGNSAAKKYDCEAWLPGQGRYRELTSTSNTTDYQARRLEIRYRPAEGGRPTYVNTLNGTAVAVGRTIIALLENGQQDDGSVRLPPALVRCGAPELLAS